MLTIKRTLIGNRLPSITNRKRMLPSLRDSSARDMVSHSLYTSRTSHTNHASLDTSRALQLASEKTKLESPVNAAREVVVEESGPVQYYKEEEEGEEGLGDKEMEELAYDDDPLTHSDYDYED